jgi:phosphohistidine phosphatase
MEIYILRHGIAEEAGAGDSDAGRALTEAGREKLGRVLDRARTAGVAPSLILTSPYRRAVETARLAGQMLGCRKIVETGVLVPEGSPEEVWDEICAHYREKALLLAGHQPLLGMTVAFLLGTSALQVDLKKAALVCIDQENFSSAPHGVLKWMLTPRLV